SRIMQNRGFRMDTRLIQSGIFSRGSHPTFDPAGTNRLALLAAWPRFVWADRGRWASAGFDLVFPEDFG
ncbi:MAG: hypothetical protein COX17_00130, partial [Deltaproteobacteria bacterium CG23_combo_of_CG06-09_8_20_14_all_60_8]